MTSVSFQCSQDRDKRTQKRRSSFRSLGRRRRRQKRRAAGGALGSRVPGQSGVAGWSESERAAAESSGSCLGSVGSRGTESQPYQRGGGFGEGQVFMLELCQPRIQRLSARLRVAVKRRIQDWRHRTRRHPQQVPESAVFAELGTRSLARARGTVSIQRWLGGRSARTMQMLCGSVAS